MKKILLLSLLVLATASGAMAGKLRASLNFATFYASTDGPYIETYLSVDGSSVVYSQNENGLFRAAIEVFLIFRKDTTIVNFRKYELLSPEVSDTTGVMDDFIDQQRIPLPVGQYDFEIRITDQNNRSQTHKHHMPVEVFFDASSVIISGIQLVDSYVPSREETILTKSGYDLIPRVSTFYPVMTNKLIYYAEIYNTSLLLGDGGKFLLNTYLTPYESGKKLEGYTISKRQDAREVVVVLQEFDLSKLPTGNYNLVIEARDSQNKLLSINSLFIQRSNPGYVPDYLHPDSLVFSNSFASRIRSRDTLSDFIQSLRPIAADFEKVFIDVGMKSAPLEVLQSYLFTFWQSRSESNPEGAFLSYLSEVHKVQQLYGSRFSKGYQTDRGRVYLQYGPPDAINENPFETSGVVTLADNQANRGVGGSVPYQIWQYYQLKNQRNKFFVFYNPHLIPGGYQLLHSDAQGELYNPLWKTQLRRVSIEDIDEGNPVSNPLDQ
mgnify:CR=1 FL=1